MLYLDNAIYGWARGWSSPMSTRPRYIRNEHICEHSFLLVHGSKQSLVQHVNCVTKRHVVLKICHVIVPFWEYYVTTVALMACSSLQSSPDILNFAGPPRLIRYIRSSISTQWTYDDVTWWALIGCTRTTTTHVGRQVGVARMQSRFV